MPAANSYAKELVLLYLNGELIDGFADGDFITISRPDDEVTLDFGSGGTQTFSHKVINHATATLTVHNGSDALDILQSLLEDQRDTASAFFTFALVDRLATDRRTSSPAAKIQKTPDMVFGDEVGTTEWTILLSNATIKHSGRLALA